MAELNDNQKLEIVLALARFETLTDISKSFGARGISVDAAQVGTYDPTRTYFAAADRWKKIFDDERQRYLTEVQTVPIANQGYRLQVLQKMLDGAIRTGNKVLANSTLRQAAEEVGGALTNERNMKITRPVDELSPEERKAALVELFAKAMATQDPPGTQPAPGKVQ